MTNSQTRPSLGEFFSTVEQRLSQRFPGEWVSFRIRVCNRVIELRFSTEEQAAKAVRSLKGRVVETKEMPDAIFKCYVDDRERYVAPEYAGKNWRISEGDDRLIYMPEIGLSGRDAHKNIFYLIRYFKQEINPLLFAHILPHLFFLWGESRNMLMAHAAVVGTDGKGVIIAGHGGTGKSTLAVSCLLAGMEFVSDDFVFFSSEGELKAFPIYSIVCLNRDMHEAMNPSLPVLWEYRKGKYALDASTYPFSPQLPVRGSIIPVFGKAVKEPEIIPIPAKTAIVRTAISSMHAWGIQSIDLTRTMISRLSGLPSFEFRQCRDFRKNAEYLREFITKEL